MEIVMIKQVGLQQYDMLYHGYTFLLFSPIHIQQIYKNIMMLTSLN
jgi:hypothetical protein